MKLKKSVKTSIAIIVIIALSLLIGFIYQMLGNVFDRNSHPRPEEFTGFVSKYSAEYGVPEYIIYAVILEESNFASNKLSEDGRIGLMQISPDVFKKLTSMQRETLDAGMLYDPETNIRYGAYYLSYLYTTYNRWNTVYAAHHMGTDAIDVWMREKEYTDELGNLKSFPEPDTQKYVERINHNSDMYRKLYYSGQN